MKGIIITDAVFEEAGDAKLHWKLIAANLPGRSGNGCRERWHTHLRPNIKKGNWSKKEDTMIQTLQKEWGNKWTKIANALNSGRTSNDVKNHWNSCKRSIKRMRLLTPNSMISLDTITRDLHKTPTKKLPIVPTKYPSSVLSLSADDFKFDTILAASMSSDTKYGNNNHVPGGRCKKENDLLMTMPQYPHEENQVHACDIFSPSYYSQQLILASGGVTTTIAQLSTPTIPFVSTSMCHSGPFVMNTPPTKGVNHAAARSGRKLFPADEDYGLHVSMTPLPYRIDFVNSGRRFNSDDDVIRDVGMAPFPYKLESNERDFDLKSPSSSRVYAV